MISVPLLTQAYSADVSVPPIRKEGRTVECLYLNSNDAHEHTHSMNSTCQIRIIYITYPMEEPDIIV